MRDMFDEYVKSRTLQNWKFWIVSLGFLRSSYSPTQCTETTDIVVDTVVPLEGFSLNVVIEFVRTGNSSSCPGREGPGQACGVGGAVLGDCPGLGLPWEAEQ